MGVRVPAARRSRPSQKRGDLRGTTSQGSAIKFVTHVEFYKSGKDVLQGSATAKVSTTAKVQCPAFADQPAGPRSYAMKGSALQYTGAPTAFDIKGDLNGPILPSAERAQGNLNGRAKLTNYLPTSSSTIKGKLEVSAKTPTAGSGRRACPARSPTRPSTPRSDASARRRVRMS